MNRHRKDEGFVYVHCDMMKDPRIQAMSAKEFMRKFQAACRGEINECSMHIRTTPPEEEEYLQ